MSNESEYGSHHHQQLIFMDLRQYTRIAESNFQHHLPVNVWCDIVAEQLTGPKTFKNASEMTFTLDFCKMKRRSS
jgi:hypothetical protein